MITNSEINNKERQLTDLMGKIVKQPLAPIINDLERLKSDILSVGDALEEANEKLDLVSADKDELLKQLTKKISRLEERVLNDITKNSAEIISVNKGLVEQQLLVFNKSIEGAVSEIICSSDTVKDMLASFSNKIDERHKELLDSNRCIDSKIDALAHELEGTNNKTAKIIEEQEKKTLELTSKNDEIKGLILKVDKKISLFSLALLVSALIATSYYFFQTLSY
jgi:septal ring factor EnvC (AmiA/AmiB activator)